MSFDYSSIPHEYPRRFVAKNIDLADQFKLRELFGSLQKRPVGSKKDLERWLEDESELASAIVEEQTIRYIRMTCQTDDPAREKTYLDFVEYAEPEVKLGLFELDRKYLAAGPRKELSRDQYFVLDRMRENNAALFREENVELEKDETKLGQKYQKITGSMTVSYDGLEKTMQQMVRYLEETDRRVREKTWMLAEERRSRDRDALDELYDELFVLRARIAKNAGFDNYRDYIFRKLARFDYTPEKCFQYHEAVEKHIVPLIREVDGERLDKLRVSPLRPWDLLVDPEGRPPLRPFKAASELIQGCRRVLERVHPDFA